MTCHLYAYSKWPLTSEDFEPWPDQRMVIVHPMLADLSLWGWPSMRSLLSVALGWDLKDDDAVEIDSALVAKARKKLKQTDTTGLRYGFSFMDSVWRWVELNPGKTVWIVTKPLKSTNGDG